jgi:tRNA(fMet)-specific endonuclease VapC
MYLFDTDHLGILQSPGSPERQRILSRMSLHSGLEFFVSIVSFHEEVQGWFTYLNQARDPARIIRGYGMFENVLANFARMQVLPYDQAAATVFASLQQVRVGTMDRRIAAIALAVNMTVLTRNMVDFRRIPGLKCEDWTLP